MITMRSVVVKNKIFQFCVVLLCFLPHSAIAQCYYDYYGFWETNDGKFIKIIEPQPERGVKGETAIGDRNEYIKAYHFIEKKIIRLESSNYTSKRKASPDRRVFTYRVLDVNPQSIEILPISDDMRRMFGEDRLTLFNRDFIPIEEVEIDSIFYENNILAYKLEIAKGGEIKMRRYSYRQEYQGKLDDFQLTRLRNLILQSHILLKSKCLRNIFCYDCMLKRLKIYHNGNISSFGNSMFYKRLNPFVNYMHEIYTEIKWKRVKNRNKFFLIGKKRNLKKKENKDKN